MDSNIYSKNSKAHRMTIYHVIYFLFILFEIVICFYYLFLKDLYRIFIFSIDENSNFILKFLRFFYNFSWCNISNNLASFSSMIGMQAICSAIIIFLYSKYSEGSHGIPTEFLIECKIGKKTIFIYRITSLLLPVLSYIFEELCWNVAAVLSAIFLYYTICIYVFLISSLMQRNKTLKILQYIIKNEILDKEKNFNTYILEEISYGYFKYEKEKCIKFQTKGQIYIALRSDIIDSIFNESDIYEINVVIKCIYEELMNLNSKNPIINFIYMYDLITRVLEFSINISKDWDLIIIEQVITTLDEKNDQDINNDLYSVLYFAIISAIINSRNKSVKEYLWSNFFRVENKRFIQLTYKLFICSLFVLELLHRRRKRDKYSEKYIKKNRDFFMSFLCLPEKVEIPVIILQCSFVFSIMGFNTDENIKQCFRDIVEDINNLNNKNYFEKTIISTLLIKES